MRRHDARPNVRLVYDSAAVRTLSNKHDREAVLARLAKLRPNQQPAWGSMSAHEMVCHLSDSFRASLGEKQVIQYGSLFQRTVVKWVALWLPFRWPHGIKTPPEMDQRGDGTRPAEFASDVEKLRILFERFCESRDDFAPHAFLGKMSRNERMRHGYLHMDHHLRQFGI